MAANEIKDYGDCGTYGELLKQTPSPVVELNRAVAIAMADGPLRGLALLNDLGKRSDLAKYFPTRSRAPT